VTYIPKERTRIAFGRAVRKRRESLPTTQEALAEKADLHRTYIADIERGVRNPSLESIRRIAYALGVSMSDLLRSAEQELGPRN
jgi:transcriptional regulator with XRE-family HTH domain